MAFEIKMVENAEGMHVDIEDLIAYLESEADHLKKMRRKGMFVGDFFEGQEYGYRTVAAAFEKALGREPLEEFE